MGEDSHRARKLPDPHVFGRRSKSRDIALRLRVPVRQLEAKRNGLGVNAVRASHHGRVFEFPRAAFEHLRQPLQILRNQRRGLRDEQRLRRVNHVIRGESVMKPARVRADDLGHRRSEGNHIVAHLGLDLLDALHAEIGALADRVRRLFGHHASLGQGLGGGNFHGQPGAKAIFIAPDAAHFRTCITRDQGECASLSISLRVGQRILNGVGERGQCRSGTVSKTLSALQLLF